MSRGAQALTDAELVAILIRIGFKGTSAVELARQLLRQFGSLRAMVEAPVIALMDVKGLKGAKAAQLLAAMEIARRVSVPTKRTDLVIKRTAVAAGYLCDRMRGLSEEQFRVLYLNRRNALLDDVLIAQGEFSPDLFIKQGDQVFVVEIKGDEEIADPAVENVKKHEFARQHFERLNEWLKGNGIASRYHFNMVTPKDYNMFFTKLREGELVGFRSQLDVAVMKAGRTAE